MEKKLRRWVSFVQDIAVPPQALSLKSHKRWKMLRNHMKVPHDQNKKTTTGLIHLSGALRCKQTIIHLLSISASFLVATRRFWFLTTFKGNRLISCKRRTFMSSRPTLLSWPIIYSPYPFVNKPKKSSGQKISEKSAEGWQNKRLHATLRTYDCNDKRNIF